MLEALGKTQQTLLKALFVNKKGLTIEALARFLAITPPAVRQHITALDGLGYLEKDQAPSTGGRPGQFYSLSARGRALFPKQYSFFSDILLRAILAEKGPEGLKDWLGKLGQDVAGSFTERLARLSARDRVMETVSIMNTMAYDASAVEEAGSDEFPAIEAVNCVYHDLAAQHPQVCQFDLALLSGLTGAQVTHEKCIQLGDNVCRFCFKK
ncbi:MAG: transcriptional regulator [Alphaproteobacteria bacterium]|nr:transcriptional regulator [Alphaproteobacteria bacterium]